MTLPSRHISISINRSPEEVYEFASRPENLPKWAAGLSNGIRKEGEEWITDSPMGPVKVKFAERNSYGVLDHDVTLPSGVVIHNPLRILTNETGSEVVFTLYRQPDMTDEQFVGDAEMVDSDLRSLKKILESRS